MNKLRRVQYAEYIGEAIRHATKETGIEWPTGTVLVAKSYSELAELDDILGMTIYASDMPSSFEFFIACPSCDDTAALQKAFLEYLEMNVISGDDGAAAVAQAVRSASTPLAGIARHRSTAKASGS